MSKHLWVYGLAVALLFSATSSFAAGKEAKATQSDWVTVVKFGPMSNPLPSEKGLAFKVFEGQLSKKQVLEKTYPRLKQLGHNLLEYRGFARDLQAVEHTRAKNVKKVIRNLTPKPRPRGCRL